MTVANRLRPQIGPGVTDRPARMVVALRVNVCQCQASAATPPIEKLTPHEGADFSFSRIDPRRIGRERPRPVWRRDCWPKARFRIRLRPQAWPGQDCLFPLTSDRRRQPKRWMECLRQPGERLVGVELKIDGDGDLNLPADVERPHQAATPEFASRVPECPIIDTGLEMVVGAPALVLSPSRPR